MNRLFLLALLLALGRVFAGTANGATYSSVLDVSTSVIIACNVSTVSIAFPDYEGPAPVYTNGDVTVTCTLGTVYKIALDAGLNYNGGLRNVFNGASGDQLKYFLYKDAGRSIEFGDGDYAGTYPSGSSLSDTGSGLAQPHPVYGRLGPSLISKQAGAYSDTVNVTVYY